MRKLKEIVGWVNIKEILEGVKEFFNWLFGLAEKFQVRIVLILIIVWQQTVIMKLSNKVESLDHQIFVLEASIKDDLRWFNGEITKMNDRAQGMKDSLYLNSLRIKEAIHEVKTNKNEK
jgi:hypothetical protein